jgi:hypothetical protein
LWAEHRTVTSSATVSLHNNTYQVDPLLVGRKVELVFDPFDLTDIEVRYQQRTFGNAVAFRIGRHAHPKARPEQPDLGPPPPSGIDYLRLLQVAHQQQLATRINYAALADVDADGHHHPQLDPADRHDPGGPAQPAPTASSPASSPSPTKPTHTPTRSGHDRASPSHLRRHARRPGEPQRDLLVAARPTAGGGGEHEPAQGGPRGAEPDLQARHGRAEAAGG